MSSTQSIQSTLIEQTDEIGTVERDDDGHLRGCPACGERWPDWESKDGQNPLVDHLDDKHWPSDFGLSAMGGRSR